MSDARTVTPDDAAAGVETKTGEQLDLTLRKEPLLLTVGLAGDDPADCELIIKDGSGGEQKKLPAADAKKDDVACVFELAPAELPNPVELWWRAPSGEARLAGPCDPVALRDALDGARLDESQGLVGAWEPPGEDALPDSPDDDDDRSQSPRLDTAGDVDLAELVSPPS
ncbi:MAG TPA: hypothetical protein VFF06_17655 [Polyangia bacterium]|nr:hypothetical protein [Polyangia bacterium]